jgi:hypothetical protein
MRLGPNEISSSQSRISKGQLISNCGDPGVKGIRATEPSRTSSPISSLLNRGLPLAVKQTSPPSVLVVANDPTATYQLGDCCGPVRTNGHSAGRKILL